MAQIVTLQRAIEDRIPEAEIGRGKSAAKAKPQHGLPGHDGISRIPPFRPKKPMPDV